MTILRAADAPTFELNGIMFTGYAAPRRGSRQLCTWRIRVAPGSRAEQAHRLDRDEAFMVLAGTVRITPGGEVLHPGDSLVVPAGEPIAVENPAPSPPRSTSPSPPGSPRPWTTGPSSARHPGQPDAVSRSGTRRGGRTSAAPRTRPTPPRRRGRRATAGWPAWRTAPGRLPGNRAAPPRRPVRDAPASAAGRRRRNAAGTAAAAAPPGRPGGARARCTGRNGTPAAASSHAWRPGAPPPGRTRRPLRR